MKNSFAVLSFFALSSFATPVVKRAGIDDLIVLNFALTLEHLENAFYKGGLEKFDEKAFTDAGLPPWARGRFVQVSDHESTHVKYLTDALGDKATQPCEYEFPYNDPKSFAALSQVLEGVGTSAYTGAAGLITNKDYLTVAASILATEARHASWIGSAVNKFAGWSGSFDVPLGLNQVFSLAAPMIKSCPASNPTLPVKAFPTLSVEKVPPGSVATFTFEGSDLEGLSAIFFTGLTTHTVPIVHGKATVPSDLRGMVYVVVSKTTTASDANTLAGPAILQYNFNHKGELVF